MKQKKLHDDFVLVYLWHAFPKSGLVDDDLAYVALLRIREFTEDALRALENPPVPKTGEE